MKAFIQHPIEGLVRFSKAEEPGSTGRENLRPLPDHLGQGGFLTINCREGMDLCLSHCRFSRQYQAQVTWPDPILTFVFCMAGTTQTRTAGLTSPIEMTAGRVYLHYFETPVLDRRVAGQKELQAVVVRISGEALPSLLDMGSASLLSKTLDRARTLWNISMDHAMQAVLFQMFACPHKGIVRSIFLESKALELVAHTLEQFLGPSLPICRPAMLEDEKRRILKARDLLIRQIKFPPALPELAREVGISHVRLTRGFKKVFGCTVFEYLRQERLAYARQLLTENRISITQVAFEAGFCSSSHFAAAFYKRFGVLPSDFRRI